ncbi:MAG TPA: APC family permease [Pyrinomonadaceae bacterium]|jgi:amino acid transporter|nr:APC family permease [Pyrinomonadaceae bacterium]
MSETTARATPELKRTLGLRDLVLFNLVAVIGFTWMATAAKAGPSALTLWVLAAVLFFVPQALAVVELSSSYPEEGGIYAWTKREFSEGHGFLCGWCYWINDVLYYPPLLLTTAVIAAYAVGQGANNPGDNWLYVFTFTLVALWLAALLNVVGMQTGKWLQNIGGMSSYLPALVIIALGVVAAFRQPAANAFNLETLQPNLKDLPSLNLWATIAFAYAGLELSSTMGQEIERPQRNLPRSIYIAAPLVALGYICGTGSLLWLVPKDELNIISGPFQAIAAGVGNLGAGLWWISPAVAALIAVGRLGSLGAWLSGGARVAFVVGLDRYFPPAFGRLHPRWHTPHVPIFVQAALATLCLLLAVLGKGTTVEKAFLILIDTSLLIYFIPYIYLFLCFIRHVRRKGPRLRVASLRVGKTTATAIGLCGLLVTLCAMCVAMIPPPETTDPLVFEAKVVGGASLLVAFGGLIYRRGRRRESAQ